MTFAELVFTVFILYLLYKLVYNVIVPVSKVTTSVRDRVQQMQQEQMRQQQGYQQQNNYSASSQKRPHPDSTTTDGEYIDFEEIK